MADNSVFITGAAKGAFEDALETLPPWATEKTAFKMQGILGAQTKLLAELVKSARTAAAGGGSMTPADAEKLNSELDKLIKNLTSNNKAEDKKKKLDKDRSDADKKSLLGIKEFDNKWQKAAFVLAGVEKIGSAILKVDQQYMKTSGELYKSGINLMSGNDTATGSIDSLNQAVKLTHLRLETLQEVAQKYSQTINAVGFTKFSKAVGTAVLGLKDMAYSGPQVAEMIGIYIESMQGFADIRHKTDQELADDAIRLSTQMTRLSVTVGMSQKQLEANLAANTKSTNSTLVFAAKGELAAKNIELFASSFKDQNVGKFFEAMSAASDPVYTAGFQALQRAGLGDIANNLAQIGKSAEILGPEAANKALDAYAKTIDPGRFKGLQDQLANHAEGAQEAADMLAGVTRHARNVSEASEDQVKKAIASQSVLTQWDTAVEHSKSLLQAAFPPLESQIVTLTTNLERLNSVADSLIKNTNSEARSWVGAGAVVASFIAGILLPMVGNIKSVMNLFSKSGGATVEAAKDAASAASKAATIAEGGAASAAGEGLLSKIFGFAKVGGTGLALALHSGELNAGEDEELAKRRKMGATVTDKKSQISVPTAPAPSVINSPSAVPVTQKSEWDDNSPSAGMPSAPMAPGIDKSPIGNDINSTLAAHTNILQQILLASENNVSVNKDILKYARNST